MGGSFSDAERAKAGLTDPDASPLELLTNIVQPRTPGTLWESLSRRAVVFAH